MCYETNRAQREAAQRALDEPRSALQDPTLQRFVQFAYELHCQPLSLEPHVGMYQYVVCALLMSFQRSW